MKTFFSPRARAAASGFSLIELMVAMGILTVLMLMLTALLDQIQKSWRFSESRISQFREARVAFDVMTKNIGQASLNTYWELRDKDSDGLFDGYFRTSELHFITMDAARLGGSATQQPVGQAIFFQAPLGFSSTYRNLNNLFNGRGYFVAFGSDKAFKPSFVQARDRYRFRLMEFRPPAESNQVFADGQEEIEKGQPQDFQGWYKQALSVGEGTFESHLNPLAENILTVVVTPRDSLEVGTTTREATFSRIAPRYEFDTNDQSEDREEFAQQVPPLVRVTMVAIDEAAAVRFDRDGSIPAELTGALTGAFSSTQNYTEDVQRVSAALNELKVSHKIFSSLVLLRSSKWST
ncbi:MAG: Verru_Chthon cassette protein C [Verrucomicrobiales bacterium]|nr:Verru_Chthon cassette protein C [Verrucomicrobiales bacterium]